MTLPGDWRPTATRETLTRRAELLRATRRFFAVRGVFEVDTPLLGRRTVPDVHLDSLSCRALVEGEPTELYLQTSPEYAMKRLLAAGFGPVYQICKAFRGGERGRRHNPEFTLLEWYRPGLDHLALMDELDGLLRDLLDVNAAERITYREAFRRAVEIDPHAATIPEIRRTAERAGIETDIDLDRDGWLELLLAEAVEPELGRGRPTLVFDFPSSQAALARVRDGDPPVAERFEAYIDGVEIANGFHELADPREQRRRFERDLERRRERGLAEPEIDERLLAALEHGLPACAGVALGFDRLVMLAVGADTIDEVIAFPADRA